MTLAKQLDTFATINLGNVRPIDIDAFQHETLASLRGHKKSAGNPIQMASLDASPALEAISQYSAWLITILLNSSSHSDFTAKDSIFILVKFRE